MVKAGSGFLKKLLVLELAGLVGAYLLYFKMDSSRDFRQTMNRRFPSVLEAYYKSYEWAGKPGNREQDALAWETRKN